jgi:hypothetical protein
MRARAALHGPSPVGLEAKVPLGGVIRRSDKGCISEARNTFMEIFLNGIG